MTSFGQGSGLHINSNVVLRLQKENARLRSLVHRLSVETRHQVLIAESFRLRVLDLSIELDTRDERLRRLRNAHEKCLRLKKELCDKCAKKAARRSLIAKSKIVKANELVFACSDQEEEIETLLERIDLNEQKEKTQQSQGCQLDSPRPTNFFRCPQVYLQNSNTNNNNNENLGSKN